MSDQSFRLTELRSLLIPFSQFAAWPILFVLTSAISLQPAYFLALALVLGADLFDSSARNRGLIRDSLAGAATVIIAVFLNDQYGVAIGAAVALVAVSRIAQKSKSRSSNN
jgi:MFS superfamily sulfate permease-like transporter